MVNFPSSLDNSSTLPDPSAGSYTNNPSHLGLHGNENAAIKALEAKLGIGASLPPGTNYILTSTSSGVSSWQPAPAAGVWGLITGTLSDQTDLVAALALKAYISAVNTGWFHAAGGYNETTTTPGVYLGGPTTLGTPRLMFADGNAARNWQVDNNGGEFRFFKPGEVHLTLKATSADFAGFKISNVADPVAAQDGATKAYVDLLGSTSLVRNETPGGSVNGSNVNFTTASTFATGSLKVYLNGQRLAPGSGIDFVEVTQGFTMQYAPLTGDVLLVDYETTNTSRFIQGSNSIIVQETPTGSVNGSNTAFTTLQAKYVANTLQVFVNGLQQTKTTDYVETTPGSGIFTFTVAPVAGDAVRVGYQFATGSSGNADTVDGIHASATATANNLYPLNASGKVPVDVMGTGAGSATVATNETTTSTSYANLTTVTDTVTVVVGANGLALVTMHANLGNTGVNYSIVAYDVSGANTIAASDNEAITLVLAGSGVGSEIALSYAKLLTGLTPGSTTFKMKYRVTAGTGNFKNRNISVIPL